MEDIKIKLNSNKNEINNIFLNINTEISILEFKLVELTIISYANILEKYKNEEILEEIKFYTSYIDNSSEYEVKWDIDIDLNMDTKNIFMSLTNELEDVNFLNKNLLEENSHVTFKINFLYDDKDILFEIAKAFMGADRAELWCKEKKDLYLYEKIEEENISSNNKIGRKSKI